jgi:hypothetical protein
MAKKPSKTSRKAPWKKSNPRKKAGKSSKTISPAKKSAAKKRAKKAARSYPNLVDNMWAASKKKKKSTAKAGKKKKVAKRKTTSKKTTVKKKAGKRRKPASRSSAKRTKDPRGGLTAAGRASFRKRDGSHLKPGVKKTISDMTPQEMRRKGSWAVRFYGRAKLPPLVDKNGEPTRHALSAHAWGEPVPKTIAAARKIAAKGHKLLDRYERLQERPARKGTARKATGARADARAAPSRKKSARKSTARKSSAKRSRKAA